MKALRALRVALVLATLGLSLLAVFPAPHDLLWKPAVFVTEWGHFVAISGLLLAIPGKRDTLSGLSFLAALLALSPLFRAAPVAAELPALMQERFGEVRPLSAADAPARSAPVSLAGLLPQADPLVEPQVEQTTREYRVAGGASLTLDLYDRPGLPGPKPAVVVIHGGSWQRGDSGQLADLNRYLAARGYLVAAVNYRLAPEHIFPAARDDVAAAVRWLRLESDALGIDPGRITLLGRSAGGQLALSAAYGGQAPKLRGVIALYAPNDLSWSWDNPSALRGFDSRAIQSDYLGGSRDEVPLVFAAASPLNQVSSGSPPTLLLHGGRDELVRVEHSRRLERALADAGVPHLYIELPAASHGFDANPSGPSGQITTWAVERFLASINRGR